MKRIFICMIFIMVFCAGCQKEEKIKMELLEADKNTFFYEGSEGADCVAVDEDGTVYISTWLDKLVESTSPESINGAEQKISVYDLDGNCIKSNIIYAGSIGMSGLNVKDGILYFTAPTIESWKVPSIFKVDTDTWEVEVLANLTQYERELSYVTLLGDYIYAIGEKKTADQEEMQDVTAEKLQGYTVFRINIMDETPKAEEMRIKFPTALFVTEDGSLRIQAYTQEQGYVIHEFQPESGAVEQVAVLGYQAGTKQICGSKYGFFYTDFSGYGSKKEIFFQAYDGISDATLVASDLMLSEPAVYKKGFLFYANQYEQKSGVWRVCVENMVQPEKILRILEKETVEYKPFPCGFLMNEQKLSSEKLALKALAGDKDFDLYTMYSGNAIAYELKECEGYYPLNEVEGVREYLDACFPGIRKMATNENGDIWMLPVKSMFTVMVYNKEYCDQNGVSLKEMDWETYVDFVTEQGMDEIGRTMLSEDVTSLAKEFFRQYLSAYDTFDTEVFRKGVSQLKESKEKNWKADVETSIYDPLVIGEIPEFYFETMNNTGYGKILSLIGTSDVYGVTGRPSIAEGTGYVVGLNFLVVNPKSDRLDATLEYITAYANYMMQEKNSFLLEDYATYSDTPFIREMYEMISKAAVYFEMEEEVYWETFEEYWNGGLSLDELVKELDRRLKMYTGE